MSKISGSYSVDVEFVLYEMGTSPEMKKAIDELRKIRSPYYEGEAELVADAIKRKYGEFQQPEKLKIYYETLAFLLDADRAYKYLEDACSDYLFYTPGGYNGADNH